MKESKTYVGSIEQYYKSVSWDSFSVEALDVLTVKPVFS